jgi:hypothetical protein
MYGIPQMPPQWASAPWGSPNGGGFSPGMGYPMGMGGMVGMGGMMGMGPMGYPMVPWGNVYGMGEQPGRAYPSPATPHIGSSSDLCMSLILVLAVLIDWYYQRSLLQPLRRCLIHRQVSLTPQTRDWLLQYKFQLLSSLVARMIVARRGQMTMKRMKSGAGR